MFFLLLVHRFESQWIANRVKNWAPLLMTWCRVMYGLSQPIIMLMSLARREFSSSSDAPRRSLRRALLSLPFFDLLCPTSTDVWSLHSISSFFVVFRHFFSVNGQFTSGLCGFRNQCKRGFWILTIWIPDSNIKNFLDSGYCFMGRLKTTTPTKPMKPWNSWNHETCKTSRPLKSQNPWTHET